MIYDKREKERRAARFGTAWKGNHFPVELNRALKSSPNASGSASLYTI